MKITLIDVPRFTFPLNHASNVVVPPLGVAYIAAAWEAENHKVQVIDSIGEGMSRYTPFGPVYLRGLPFPEIVGRIERDTDLIAVSNMFSCGWPAVRLLLAEIRKAFPNRPIIMGGEHPTGMPDLVFKQSSVDYIVAGEGEETAVELAAHISHPTKAIEDIEGIYHRKNGHVIRNNPRKRIRDVDSIAEPAWHHFRIDDYIAFGQPHGAVQGRYLPMLATRGCPYRCTFCTNAQMWTQMWIPRDYKKVVDEMEKYIRRYQVTDFHFEDLTAIVRRDWMLNFAGEIVRRGLKVTYQLPSGTRSEAIDREVSRALKASGCSDFPFAPESADVRVLKAIEKKVNLEALFKAADQAIAEGISVTCNFIIGFPEDDWLSVFNMYKAVIRCAWHGFSGVNINAYSPQPNTTSFRQLVQAGRIKEFDDKYFLDLFTFQSFFVKKASYNERFSETQITWIIIVGFFIFYAGYFILHPKRLAILALSLFRRETGNKSTSYARSMIREIGRIWRFRRSLKDQSFSHPLPFAPRV